MARKTRILFVLTAVLAVPAQPGLSAQEPVTVKALKGAATSLVFSPDGKTLFATGPAERSVLVWDIGQAPKYRAPSGGLFAKQLMLGAGGKTLLTLAMGRADERAAGGRDGPLAAPSVPVLWTVLEASDLATGKPAGSTDLGGVFNRAALSPDGKLVALRRHHYKVKDGQLAFDPRPRNDVVVFDLGAKRERFTTETERDCVGAFAFTPDGKTLLLADKGSVVRLVDVETGKDRAALESLGPEGLPRGFWLKKGMKPEALANSRSPITGLSLSADGMLLTTSHESRDFPQVFDLATGAARLLTREELPSRFLPDKSPFPVRAPLCVASPDGRTVATAGGPMYLALFDAATGKLLANHNTGKFQVALIAFSPDSKRVAAALSDGTIQVWPVPAEAK